MLVKDQIYLANVDASTSIFFWDAALNTDTETKSASGVLPGSIYNNIVNMTGRRFANLLG